MIRKPAQDMLPSLSSPKPCCPYTDGHFQCKQSDKFNVTGSCNQANPCSARQTAGAA